MGIGVSVFLLAVGAILTFALDREVEGIDLDTVGIILMIVGLIGLAVFLITTSGGMGRRRTVSEQVVEDAPVRRRTTRDDY